MIPAKPTFGKKTLYTVSIQEGAKSIYCETHQLYHINDYSNVMKSDTINNIIFLKIVNKGVHQFGEVRNLVSTYNASQSQVNCFVLQMSIPCQYGLTSDSKYNLDCTDKTGIICLADHPQTCQGTSIHESLMLCTNGRFKENNICCVKTCELFSKCPTLQLGGLFLSKNGKIKDAIVCKWMGLINNVECVAGETKSWHEYGSDGKYCGVKVFDCKIGHGLILRVEDIYLRTSANNRLFIDPSGFINIEQTLGIKTQKIHDTLSVGCRVKVIYNRMNIKMTASKLYGEIRWMGLIDENVCVGVELDSPCADGMSGIISGKVNFQCKEKHGIIVLGDDVELDVLSYLPSFTIGEDYKTKFNQIRGENDFQENCNHDILKDKGIKYNSNIFFQIEKKNRKIKRKTKLIWFGHFKSLTFAIVEMDYISTLQSNIEIQSLIPPQLMIKNKLLLPINPIYIFGYEESLITNEGNSNLGSIKSYQNDIEGAYLEGVKYVLDVIQPDKEVYNNLLEIALDSNTKILKCLIERSVDSVDIIKYPSMLEELKKLQLDDVINQLTTNCVIDDASDEQLLRLAKVALKNDNDTIFYMAIDKCTDRDMIMSDGETFLTGIIKDHLSTKAITMALDTNKFSATKSNNKSETPMMLVCSNMMVDMVEILLLVIKNQSIQAVAKTQVLCSICMDHNMGIVFGCGHNCCKECSDNIDHCHMCSKEITQRVSIFFNN